MARHPAKTLVGAEYSQFIFSQLPLSVSPLQQNHVGSRKGDPLQRLLQRHIVNISLSVMAAHWLAPAISSYPRPSDPCGAMMRSQPVGRGG